MLMTRFQQIQPVRNHKVTKNLTGHRMHVESTQIYQMNRQINSFQNMCDMLEAIIDRLSRKTDFVQKNISKSPFLVDTNLSYLTLEEPERQVNFRPTPENLGV